MMMTERILHDIYMQQKAEGDPAKKQTPPVETDEIISDGSGGAFEQTEEVTDTRDTATIEEEEEQDAPPQKRQYY
jgi:hypothetical protein